MFLRTKPDAYREDGRDFWFRLRIWHFGKSKCFAVRGCVSPATRGFLRCPLSSLSCLRLGKIFQKTVKPKYNPFVMKHLFPDPSEGLFNFQRLKCNYDCFSMPNLAHCPFLVMVAVCFERNSHAFFFKICIFILKYRFNLFHKMMTVIRRGKKGRGEKKKKTIPANSSTVSVEVSFSLSLSKGVFSTCSCYMKCTNSIKS